MVGRWGNESMWGLVTTELSAADEKGLSRGSGE
jgi:hypothetical protein